MIICRRFFLWCSGVGRLSRPSANQLGGLQRGGIPWLNLAVCPSAACSPTCRAKVPHSIAVSASCPAAVSNATAACDRCASTYQGGRWRKFLLLFPAWHVRHNSSQSHQRELSRATAAKHRSPSRHGLLVLIGRAFAPQPNWAVKWDADKLHRFGSALWAPLTLALGFWCATSAIWRISVH